MTEQLAHLFLDYNRIKTNILFNHYALVFTPELAKAMILSSDPEKERKTKYHNQKWS